MSSEKIFNILIILAVLAIIGVIYTYAIVPYLQEVRGPAIDITVNTELNSDGNLSEYSMIAKMPDSSSYNKYLAYVNSKGYSTIKEYFLRDIADKTLFDYSCDKEKMKLSFKSTKTFDPNEEMKTVNIDKSNWIFNDSSFVLGTEYFFPDRFVDSISYTFTTHAAIFDTTGETSEYYFKGNKSDWLIERHKDSFDSTSNSIIIPPFIVKTSQPQASPGLLLAFFAIAIIWFFRKHK